LRTQDEVLILGSMAEKSLMDAMEALRDGDPVWSRKIIEDDQRINRKRFEIEDRCIFVIGSQQPMASDLRGLASILYIITDLERIADHAEGVARINMMLADEPLPRLGYIAIADRTVAMLQDSRSVHRAGSRGTADLQKRTTNRPAAGPRVRDSTAAMIADPKRSAQRYMLWTAHNLERIADRC
jgi:phosphate transport system protein